MANRRVHVLQYPLRIASPAQDEWYLLPAGTTLYYDDSMPEGFDRYRVYINVEGAVFDPAQAVDQHTIAPLSAYPIDGDDIVSILRKYPVSKEDLVRLLKAHPLSAEEARQLIDLLQTQFIGRR